MKKRELAIRAQDIDAGFDTLNNLPTFAKTEFKNVALAGKASRLAAHIQGAEVFGPNDIRRLEYVADSLGIDPISLPIVLRFLEQAEMVTVVERGSNIHTVRENVPEFQDLHDRIGQNIDDKSFSELESATLETYHSLAGAPVEDAGDLPIQLISENYRKPLLEICDQATLIKRIDLKNRDSYFYSPQYWDENIEQSGRVIKDLGIEEVNDAFRAIRQSPGKPITIKSSNAVKALAQAGLFPSPSVTGLSGEIAFAFTPYKGFAGDEIVQSKRMEKVRALIACVRYGQHYGSASRIRNPIALLNALLEKKRLNAHSDAYTQYKLLFDQGIVRLERVSKSSDRFITTLIDTADNRLAISAAINLLRSGQPVEAIDVNEELANYARSSSYSEPIRARIKKIYNPGGETQALIHQTVQAILTT